MKRLSSWTACLAFVFALSSLTSSASARTSVSVDLHFGDRYRGPDVVFYDEPDVVVVPGTRVYYVRDYDYDMYRCGRFWYYNYDGGWYRARNYRGPWIYVGYRSVPRDVGYVPYRYRRHWREFREEPRYTYRDSRNRDRGWLDRDRGEQNRDRGWRDRDRGEQNRDRGWRDRDRGQQNRDRGWRDRDRDERGDGRQDR
ncbi:MAG: hypothetical protein E6K77_07405 [Candidatus Eisenbacteria bacterium]|uniref:BcpO-related WXXGXW repeat protein n=1 Tax=Eiseniibacteriota bacterium TaxID=2212470 RepID=A0A538SRR7_UNCEI|nr:MAG: hypothetical protein E6K74_07445 [Candidatus Eisenbacteria bacterium]TMQ62435.1 MAG: hypothetical protein E6K77_07405 [Candidatus Eisenbacteria bacterium]